MSIAYRRREVNGHGPGDLKQHDGISLIEQRVHPDEIAAFRDLFRLPGYGKGIVFSYQAIFQANLIEVVMRNMKHGR